MSYWGYVIEQLINDDERQIAARRHARKRRLAGSAGRSQASLEDGATPSPSARRRRLGWPLLTPRH